MSPVAWVYFHDLAAEIRRDQPEAEVKAGARGVRQVLRTWIEERIREEVG